MILEDINMNEIVIGVEDQSKAWILVEMLSSLNFVSSIHVKKEKAKLTSRSPRRSSISFFDYAGLWEGRELDQTTLREKAWPRR
jgi:hypothetical protein